MDRSPTTWQSYPAPTERLTPLRRESRNWSSTSPATSRRSYSTGGLSMRGNRLPIGLRAALAIFAAAVLMTSTWAATQEKVLHNFTGADGSGLGADLIMDAAGNIYGTTGAGGTYFHGTVFELTPGADGSWTEKVLYSFGNYPDGSEPSSSLVFDAAGNLYGTTYQGGAKVAGTVFELTSGPGGSWTKKLLHTFNSNGTDGAYPAAGVIFDAAGNLYGTTSLGGTDADGPLAGLIFDAAGNLYGTTYSGGAFVSYGTVFEITNTPPAAYQFVTVTPCRLVDTRPDHGGSGPIQGGTFQTFPIPQEGGCNIPATAAAYSLNVSVVPLGGLGYLTMWPAGVDLRPLVSTLNSVDGRI